MKKILKLLCFVMFFGIAFQLNSYAIPDFSYSGSYSTSSDATYWYIYLKSSGTLKFTSDVVVDTCIVGGGAGGSSSNGGSQPGGGGGKVVNRLNVSLTSGKGYSITVGAGGAVNTAGSSSSAFGTTAAGGSKGGGGSSGGGAGSAGSYAFDSSSYSRYGGGGGGGGSGGNGGAGGAGGAGGGGKGAQGACFSRSCTAATAGGTNTGGGGGGQGGDHTWKDSDGSYSWNGGGSAAKGGSGIVIIRGKFNQSDVLPFSYTGNSMTTKDDTYWYVYLKSSGTLTFSKNLTLDACIVGGGAGGSSGEHFAANGGGGGTVTNRSDISVTTGTNYTITIGAGGAVDTAGGSSSAFGTTAAGGAVKGGGAGGSAGPAGSYAFGNSSYSRYGGGGGGGGAGDGAGAAGAAGGAGGGGNGGQGACFSRSCTAATAGGTNTGGGGGGHGGAHTWKDSDGYDHNGGGAAAAGGSGIVIIRVKIVTCKHDGGTHANGGTCTKCGTVYQTHNGTVIGYDKDNATDLTHIKLYNCTYPGCAGKAEEDHDFSKKDGICTKCGLECQGTIGVHLAGIYDGIERKSGECLVCGKVFAEHLPSNNVAFYLRTKDDHIPYYKCNKADECSSLFEGVSEKHNFIKIDGHDKCSVCGYYEGMEVFTQPSNIATCADLSVHTNDKQYDRYKVETETGKKLSTAIPLKVQNVAEIEGNTEERYGKGDEIKLFGTNYANQENIHWYNLIFLSKSENLVAPLNNYFHWKVRAAATYVHKGPSSSCTVGVHDGNTEYACQNRGAFNGGHFELGSGEAGHANAVERWKNRKTWIEEFSYKKYGDSGLASEAEVMKKALELLTGELNTARIEKKRDFDVYLLANADPDIPSNYVTIFDNNIISLQYLQPEYIHCCNSWNYELVNANATATVAQRCKHLIDGHEKLYGDISVRFEGFTVNNFELTYGEEAAKWPSGINVDEGVISKQANWNVSFNLDELVREEIRFDANKEPYGMIYVTSTAPDGTTQTVEIKVPLAYVPDRTLEHFTANLSVNELAWNQEKLYRPGDILELDGTRCIYDEKYEIFGETETEFSQYNGVIINFKGFEVESNGKRFTGIDTRYNKNEEVVWGERGYDYEDADLRYWDTDSYKIVDIANAFYDSTRGVHYGEIEIIGLEEHGCKIVFKIYFGTPVDEVVYPVDVTIKINPSDSAGTVTVDYIAYKGETEAETITGLKISDNEGAGTVIKAVLGTSITIHSTANEGYVYRDITTAHGNKLEGSENNNFSYGPINVPMTFIVNFEKDPPIPNGEQDKYILYVTSTEGGNAWLDDPRISNDEDEMYNKFGSRIYTVRDVDGGEEFTLYYETYEGYEFEKWEYRPRIKADSQAEGSVQITMPYSDLTATAVFKKVKQEAPNTDEDGDKTYTLRVTSNNEVWGDAWVYINGAWTDRTDGAIAGQEYLVYFVANPGYYFTNWDYDSFNSPFVVVDKESGYGRIKMPNNDLEIKAFFSPIPEPGDNEEEKDKPDFVDPETPEPPTPKPNPDNPNPDPNPEDIPQDRLHKIYFVSELEDRCDGRGGTVPEDLIGVRGGAVITMAVTPYSGCRFVRWYFTDATEHKNGNHLNEGALTPDREYDKYGSGSFIMTDYDIVAHAVFEEVAPTNKLTIKIVGEGSVFVEDIDIPSGSWYEAEPDKTLNIKVEPAEGWEYIYSVDKDGKVVSENPNFTFKMPAEDTTLIIHFGYNNKEEAGPYTLYVTSMYGGNAWTEGNDKHPREGIEVTQNHLGQYIYTVKNVYAGEKFEIYYNVEKEGYTFDEWEYRPYITPDKEGRGVVTITMPYSDLTVTAVFKNDTIQDNPTLSVTSNNPEWGNAYVIINDVPETATNMKAVAGAKYQVVYKANPGYYFTNWDYSTTDTPFIDADGLAANEAMILMPNKNLEIMAFFSPIPEPEPEDPEDPEEPKPVVEGHAIDFTAEPPEGGRVPQDLTDIKPGSKVTIAVTPNQGWEFSHWYFKDKDGVIVTPDVYYDEDGTGYFIMPDYPIEAIAVFKKSGIYTLYVTSTGGGSATAIVNGVETDKVENAIPRNLYDVIAKPEIGYKVTWEYRWDTEADNSIIPGIYMDELGGKVIMPRSDLTVTAIFTKENPEETTTPKLKVTSNNYIWGDAFVKVDGEEYSWRRIDGSQNASDEPGKTLEAGKEYEVRFEAFTGYEFTDWISSDLKNHFKEYPDFENGDTTGIIVMPDYDIELMAYFKPGDTPDSGKTYYTLTLKSDPAGAATLFGDGVVEEGTERYVGVDDYDPEDYKFKYWYRKDINGKEIKVSNSMNFDYTVRENTTLYAKFDNISPTISNLYTVTIIKEGDGNGYVVSNGREYVKDSTRSNITCKKGTELVLKAIEETGSFFNGWVVNGKSRGSLSIIDLEVTQDLTIIVSFTAEKTIPQGTIEDFKIISVRDLRWQDYFVENGKLTGKVFTTPITLSEAEVMLKAQGNRSDELKMGYAVEFELVTMTYDHERAVLVVRPEILDKNGNPVLWEKIKDGLTGSVMDKAYMDQVKDFSKVIVVHNTSGKPNAKKLNDYYQASYQTSSSWNSNATNNGISTEEITWRWLYYVPAKLEGVNGPITVKFNVEIYEMSGDFKEADLTNSKQKFDMVTYLNTYKNTKWNGRVYKYSENQSLLEDIYNNAT
ncbi:MAG: hypothetical protein J6M02_00640 [Clostridia bacterium]|nr:hypothetical protein [Clostridia bacterium]